jgi:AcrR family transcriptional regulator
MNLSTYSRNLIFIMPATKINAWVKAGYKLLGTEGTEGMKIERLARILKLNKSGFYYYFGSMESYVARLLEYHTEQAKTISEEITGCENIDPDLLLVIVKYKEFFLVESQLLVKSRPWPFGGNFDEAGQIVSNILLPLWRKTSGLQVDSRAAMGYLNIIRHFFYARIDREHINYEFLHELTSETREVLDSISIGQRETASQRLSTQNQ